MLPPQPKNINFYGSVSKDSMKENLWENKHRTSRKISLFYQKGQQEKLETFNKKDLEGKKKKEHRQLSQ
jgi:hypothetical protein